MQLTQRPQTFSRREFLHAFNSLCVGSQARPVEETCSGIRDWQDEEKEEVSAEVSRQKARQKFRSAGTSQPPNHGETAVSKREGRFYPRAEQDGLLSLGKKM